MKRLTVFFIIMTMFFSLLPAVSAVGSTSFSKDVYPESEHNYSNNMDEWMSYTYPDASVTALTIKFSEQSMLDSWNDYIAVYDSRGFWVYSYTDSDISGAELTVDGNSFFINMTSDDSFTAYGFSIDSITPSYGDVVLAEELYIDPPDGSLIVGSTRLLAYNIYIYPENATEYLIWESSDTSIATVDNGILTAKGCGSVRISVTTSEGSCSDWLYIEINEPIYLNATDINLNIGDSFKLEAFDSKLNSLPTSWETYDSSVITLDPDGTIHAIGKGSASIYDYETELSCSVDVTDGTYFGPVINGPWTIVTGQEYEVPFTGINTDSFFYGSSNDSFIAEYDSYTNTVTAVSEGKTQLHIYLNDHDYDYHFDYYIDVNVISPYINANFTVENGIITDYKGDVENLVIPEEIDGVPITGIGFRAFEYASFKQVEIPSSVTRIDDSAFAGCRLLEEIFINEGVEEIGYGAFSACEAVKHISLPSTLLSVDDYALGMFTAENITYNGNKQSWINLKIGYDNSCLSALSSTYGNVSTAEDLYMIAEAVNSGSTDHYGKTFTLTNDISLNNSLWVPIGVATVADIAFRGTFNGNGYTISDFVVSDEYLTTGFFGYVRLATISDLNIKNGTIIPGNGGDDYSWTGIFAGWLVDSTVTNCTSSGIITTDISGDNNCIGGFVGRISDSDIVSCSSDSVINVNESLPGYANIGGFTGYMYASLTDCAATADIHCNNLTDYLWIGGITGYQAHDSKTVTKCTSKGNIYLNYNGSGKVYAGGLIGYNYVNISDNISYTNIIYDSPVTINAGSLVGYSMTNDSSNIAYGTVRKSIFISDINITVNKDDKILTVQGISTGDGTLQLDLLQNNSSALSTELSVSEGNFSNEISISDLDSGNYNLIIKDSDRIMHKETVNVPVKEHVIVIDAAVAPTCTETGLTEGSHCSVCSEVITPQNVVPASGHKVVIMDAVKPTYESTGLTEGSYCSVCDEILIHQEIIPKKESSGQIIISSSLAIPGETVIVTARIASDTGIAGYKLTVDYDQSLLTPVSIEPNKSFGGTFTTNLNNSESGDVNIVWYSSKDVNLEGDLFTMKFIVDKNASESAIGEISLIYEEKDISNSNGEDIDLEIKSGTVTVSYPVPGDIHEDSLVKTYDLILLARYVAGMDQLTERQLNAGDVNNDNTVNGKDVVLLARNIVGMTDAELMNLIKTHITDITPCVYLDYTKANSEGIAEIDVYIENNPGIAYFDYTIDFNDNDMEIISITPNPEINGSFLTNLEESVVNSLKVFWYDTENLTQDGKLFTIKVRKKNTDALLSPIAIIASDESMADENGTDVSCSYVHGGILSEEFIVTNETVIGTTFSCSIYFDNSFENQSAISVVAFYDDMGQLVHIERFPVNTRGKVELSANPGSTPYTSYKIMIWDSFESLTPLTTIR